ncbi:hypothetical protein A3G53_02540 [Candidatus Nomurabacteria bacterium RIFCSPLOWO2_12_FULL_44_11]|uniref:Cell shape-determining protein MreC n=1 Tax=Candidatus Nomurabacteria bacterium RIFCSPLOWO2_12_FULL_44_11 TaxID=1801796 RepID=A0A1F6Y5I0_9BACT|nr:MAG: hypothetical protein A3G53_02540 [Candidatus Nomurabacteria bacterium RIFCSPLOWO2_12_FULL_44_11]
MSYLQDRKVKNKKIINITIVVVLLFVLFYFRAGIFKGLSYISGAIFRPVLVAGNNVGNTFSNISAYFASKNSLTKENEDLKLKLSEKDAKMANYNALLDENNKLKDVLGRKNAKADFIVSAILAKPNQSPYDTLIIDAGNNQGASAGDLVFALGNIPIGRVSEVGPSSAKVILFSNPGEKTEVVIEGRDVFTTITGRGGGNFEMIVSRDFTLERGATVVLPGITPYVVGVVQTIISDPRDAFTKALLTSPVNIFELKFVEVEK